VPPAVTSKRGQKTIKPVRPVTVQSPKNPAISLEENETLAGAGTRGVSCLLPVDLLRPRDLGIYFPFGRTPERSPVLLPPQTIQAAEREILRRRDVPDVAESQ
jgi:hypothetical protein